MQRAFLQTRLRILLATFSLAAVIPACAGGVPSTGDAPPWSEAGVDAGPPGPLADAGVDSGAVDAGLVSYVHDIQPIWNQYCAACHYGRALQFGRDATVVRNQLVTGVSNWPVCGRFVVPGKPEESLLFFKLSGHSSVGHESKPDCARLMPADLKGNTKSGTPLIQIDPTAVEKVRLWIAAGAPAN